jgi:PPM family protein phosphatase
MKSLFTGLSDQGLLRTANQDAYFIDEPEGRFFIVADGMGGHAGGQEASRMATQVISDHLDQHLNGDLNGDLSGAELLQAAFLKANQFIVQDQLEHPERSDMGTTAVAVLFSTEGQPWCAHIGDSRLYRLRGEELTQITEDHTWIAHAVRTGTLLPEQARNHPWRHVLAQCLGREDIQDIEVQPLDLQPGDRLLLCSDGLTEELSDPLIAIYLEEENCQKAAKGLVEAAKDKGGRDNITVVIVAIPEGISPQS